MKDRTALTIAEIHGKLSATGSNISDRLEDLLTSDVFSVFKYTDPEVLLIPYLRSINSKIDRYFIEYSVHEVDYYFWPRFLKGTCEPDMLLQIRLFSNNNRTYKYLDIMIEAKYESPLSNRAEEISDPYDDKEQIYKDRHQLAYEFKGLINGIFQYNNQIKKLKSSENDRFLLYLTSHYMKPDNDIESGIIYFDNKEQQDLYKERILWSSWRDIWKSLNKASDNVKNSFQRLMIKDLIELLERKGFKLFSGFTLAKIIISPIQFWNSTWFYDLIFEQLITSEFSKWRKNE